jgi:hypothetical protein
MTAFALALQAPSPSVPLPEGPREVCPLLPAAHLAQAGLGMRARGVTNYENLNKEAPNKSYVRV